MPKQVEAAIENEVCDIAEAAGWFVRKLTYPGRKGAPDRWFLKNGRHVHIEFKNRWGQQHALQEREQREIRAHGGEYHLCRSVEEALEILGIEHV